MLSRRGWQYRTSNLLSVAALAVGAAFFTVRADAQVLPALPQTFLDTAYPPMAGQNTLVPAGGNLQSAINAAQRGDTILLEAGATYAGSFTLPVKSGTGWVIIRTSAPDSSLPPAGTRITPAYASVLPKIAASGVAPAMRTLAGAHGYRLTGVEIMMNAGVTTSNGLVQLGDTGTAQDSLTEVPYDLVLDRVYVHGTPTGSLHRGVSFNCASCAVIDSHISDVHRVGFDTQAICGWNGPGPFKIVNNYLEASGENVMFGGGDPDILNMVPSDIEVRRNHFYKPLTWKIGHPTYAGTAWTVKNIFELKNARRVLVDGNIFEHNWPHAQNGFSILFTVRNQDGSAPWSVVEDVTFTNNIVRHVASAVNILGTDDLQTSLQTKRILIRNNLFDDVNAATWGGSGRLLQMLDGAADVTLDHNTAFQSGEVIFAAGLPNLRFTYRNNLTPNNQFGVAGDNTTGNPLLTLLTYFPVATFVRNVLVGGNPTKYPPDNFFPATMAAVMFVDFAGGNYRLQPGSPYNNAGSDGQDVGADFDALDAALSATPIDAPTLFSATATSASQVGLTWMAVIGATSYEIERASVIGSFANIATTSATSVIDGGRSANTTYLYRVRAIGAGGTSAFSAVDAATTIVFTDGSLTGALIKAIHVNELRTAVNAMRTAANLPAASFTDNLLSGVIVKGVHVTELRAFVDAARSTIGLTAMGYTDQTISAGTTTVKAVHIQQLRVATQ